MTRENYPNNRVHFNIFLGRELAKLTNSQVWLMNSFLDENKIIDNNKKEILLFRLKKIFSSSMFSKLFNVIEKYKTLNKLLSNKKIDVVYVRNGYFESLMALYLRKKHNYIFCYHLSSLFHSINKTKYEHYPNLKSYVNFSFSYFANKITNIIIKKADIFIPVSDSMSNNYNKLISPSRTITVPLCADDNFLNFNKNKMHTSNNLLYIGQLSTYRDSLFLLKVLDILVNKFRKDYNLLIAGNITDSRMKKDFNHFLIKHKIKERVKMDFVSYEELPYYTSKSSIGLSPRKPYPADKCSSPTKVIDYLSLGIPTIANYEIPDQRFILEKSKGGLLVPYNVHAFAEAIIKLSMRKNVRLFMGEKGRNWLFHNRNYKYLADDFYNVLKLNTAK